MTDTKFLVGLGDRIKKIRLAQKMQQNDLAALCGFEKAAMSRIEAGKRNITVLTLKKISKALKTDMCDFFS